MQKKYYRFFNYKLDKLAKKGRGFYYENFAKDIFLRFAVFEQGYLTAIVVSKYPFKKIKQLLSKQKPLKINRCCGFKVLESTFKTHKSQGKSHYQLSRDKGKTFHNYEIGSNKEIDSIFANATEQEDRNFDWFVNDFVEIFEPNFEIIEITKEYKARKLE
tara:strand:+ start:27622 stop:28101 length:480 start_codon:yes stop_codon:yes gene_type:complete